MEANPGVVARARSPIRQWLSGWGFSQWWKAIVAVVLASTALFGGLDTVDTGVTTFKPGDEFSDGEFTVKFERAALMPEVRAGSRVIAKEKPGRRYLAVLAVVRNDGTVPGQLSREVDLRNQPDKVAVDQFRFSDSSRIATIGPGLTEQIAFVWELPQDALSVGDSVTLRIWKKQFRQTMVSYGQTWLDSNTDYGETVIPVGSPR